MSPVRSIAVLILGTAIWTGACTSVNELRMGVDVECGSTPDVVCSGAVDLATTVMAADIRTTFEAGLPERIVVYQIDCADTGVRRPVVRCWEVEFGGPDGGISSSVFELPDGSLSASRQ